jgi:hypothetical protein
VRPAPRNSRKRSARIERDTFHRSGDEKCENARKKCSAIAARSGLPRPTRRPQQAPSFDLTSASVVRFAWDSGRVDHYLDNVRFYRTKSYPPPAPPYTTPPQP